MLFLWQIVRLEASQSLLITQLSELDLKQLHENTCYDGGLLWKIDNYAHQLNQAVTGKVTALHSAPCCTKKYGYRFCARLYLNGDGMGRNTHLSLFFVLMKSEYDNMQEWPFRKRVTFRLINYDNQGNSYARMFKADGNSENFKKPVTAMNPEVGFSQFITQELVGNYVVGNSLFIEIYVDDAKLHS